jgi:virginiamycin B lyase
MKPDRRTSLPLLLLLASVLVAALVAGPAVAAEYPEWKNVVGVPDSLAKIGSRAPGITQGPDGNTWFAGTNGVGSGLLGFVGPTTPFTVWAPSQFTSDPVSPQAKTLENLPLRDITTGPDGNLWATNPSASVVLRVTPQGTITSFPLTRYFEVKSPLQEPQEIVTGPDGALWVTANAFGGAIGRVAPDGTFTAFPLGTGADQGARGLAVGPDGALWFTEPGAGTIGRITTAGAITTFKLAAAGAEPNEITLGPDGNLWFTEGRGTKVGRVTPQGKITEFAAESAGPIVSGPEGDLWFGSANGIGSITTDGVRGA